jgi:hypothetical protein
MLSDTLTVALVLLLLVGSIVLYLYTCIQQSEQKINLLESILLDLKMSNEIKSYTELPAADLESQNIQDAQVLTPIAQDQAYVPFDDDEDPIVESKELDTVVIDELPTQEPKNYDSMTLKELSALAKSRGIVGVTKKGPLIEALHTSDRVAASSVADSSLAPVGSVSLFENSAPVSDESL